MENLDEQRAQNLFSQFKCITCSGENINEFAKMLREDVDDYIKQGLDDKQIIQKVVQIYGDDIMLTSSYAYGGLLMWMIPLIVIIFGLGKLNSILRRAGDKTGNETPSHKQ